MCQMEVQTLLYRKLLYVLRESQDLPISVKNSKAERG